MEHCCRIVQWKQAGLLLKANIFSLCPIHTERHIPQLLLGRCWHQFSGWDDRGGNTLTVKYVSKAYHLTGKRDDKQFPLHIVFLIFKVPAQPSTIHQVWNGSCVTISNPICCFQCQKSGPTQQCYVSRLMMLWMKLHVPTCHTVLTAVEVMHQMRKFVSSVPEWKIYPRTWGQGGVSFLKARKKFQES